MKDDGHDDFDIPPDEQYITKKLELKQSGQVVPMHKNYHILIVCSNSIGKNLNLLKAENLIMTSRDEFLWVEKYRPKTIEDCILPDDNQEDLY